MIRIISTTTIRPERSNGDEEDEFRGTKIDLTPSELYVLIYAYGQRGLLFHKPPTATTVSLVKRLKDSFAQALSIYYPLAGRLISVDNNDKDDTKSFFIDCNAAGAEFVHATADGSVTAADILDPVDIPEELVYSFFTMNGVLNHEAANSGLPLLSVQITELADAVFVACTMNHTVADGTFSWRFFRTWSDIARATGTEVHHDYCKHRFFGRGYLDGIIDLPILIPKRSLVAANLANDPCFGQLEMRMFHFSKETVAMLKARANAEVRSAATYGVSPFGAADEISSLQSLLGHLWVAVTRGRGLAMDEVVNYTVIVGLRQRMGLPESVPDEHLGNLTCDAFAESTAEEVVRGGLGAAALLIKKAIATQTVDKVKSFLKKWAVCPKFYVPAANPLMTGGSPRFDVYGCDFGWGRPVAMRSGPGFKANGMLTLFPGSEQGSIDCEACLYADIFRALDSDPDFVQTLA